MTRQFSISKYSVQILTKFTKKDSAFENSRIFEEIQQNNSYFEGPSEFEILQPPIDNNGIKEIIKTSVAYPYHDPYVFRHPGFGPGLSSRIGRKTLIPTVLRFRNDLSLRKGSADLDPFQNVKNPQLVKTSLVLKRTAKFSQLRTDLKNC